MITTFLLLSIAVCFLNLTACKNDEAITLSSPTGLNVNDECILTWDKVDGASSYLVEIDDKKYETQTNSLDIFASTVEYKTYEIKVTAYGDLIKYFDSEPSQVFEYTLPEVSGLEFRIINDGAAYRVRGFDRTQGGKLIVPAEYEGKPVVEVVNGCFSFCDKLTSVVLPDSIKKIDHGAFEGCTNLKRVKLPYYLQTFGNVVFCGTALTEIELPPLIPNIWFGIFEECDNLTKISMPDDTGDYLYTVDGNCLIRKQDNALIAGCKTSTIPNYVKSIEENAFNRLKTLTQITIPDGVETIGWDAFGYTGLIKVHIPSGVRKILRAAFYGCTNLKEVTFAEGVEIIGREESISDFGDNPGEVFGGCKNLKSVYLPASLKRVDGSSFLGCTNLEEISVSPESDVYKSDGNRLIRKQDNCLVLCGNKVSTIPDYVEKIGNYAFFGTNLTEIELPAGLTEIGNYAFYRNKLKQIILPDGVEKIGAYAFENSDFTQLTLPKNLKEIGSYAFKGCKKLKSIIIPDNVETIGASAFEDCHGLYVVLPDTVKTIKSGAFDGAVIYTTASSRPEGWKYVIGVGSNYRWATLSCLVFWESTLGYDGNQPYVKSWEKVVNKDKITASSAAGLQEVFGYIPVPIRSGYKFMGWATEEGSTEVVYSVTFVDPSTFVYEDDVSEGDRYYGDSFYSWLTMDELFRMPNGTTLYAVWEAVSE